MQPGRECRLGKSTKVEVVMWLINRQNGWIEMHWQGFLSPRERTRRLSFWKKKQNDTKCAESVTCITQEKCSKNAFAPVTILWLYSQFYKVESGCNSWTATVKRMRTSWTEHIGLNIYHKTKPKGASELVFIGGNNSCPAANQIAILVLILKYSTAIATFELFFFFFSKKTKKGKHGQLL